MKRIIYGFQFLVIFSVVCFCLPSSAEEGGGMGFGSDSPVGRAAVGDWVSYRLEGCFRWATVVISVTSVRSNDVELAMSIVQADGESTTQLQVPKKIPLEALADLVLNAMALGGDDLNHHSLSIEPASVSVEGHLTNGLILSSRWEGFLAGVSGLANSRRAVFSFSPAIPLLGLGRMELVDIVHLSGNRLVEEIRITLLQSGKAESEPIL